MLPGRRAIDASRLYILVPGSAGFRLGPRRPLPNCRSHGPRWNPPLPYSHAGSTTTGPGGWAPGLPGKCRVTSPRVPRLQTVRSPGNDHRIGVLLSRQSERLAPRPGFRVRTLLEVTETTSECLSLRLGRRGPSHGPSPTRQNLRPGPTDSVSRAARAAGPG